MLTILMENYFLDLNQRQAANMMHFRFNLIFQTKKLNYYIKKEDEGYLQLITVVIGNLTRKDESLTNFFLLAEKKSNKNILSK